LRRNQPSTRRHAKPRKYWKVVDDTPGLKYVVQPRNTGLMLGSRAGKERFVPYRLSARTFSVMARSAFLEGRCTRSAWPCLV
jgi:hypothetical protein